MSGRQRRTQTRRMTTAWPADDGPIDQPVMHAPPVGRFGFSWLGKPEIFYCHEFETLKVDAKRVTLANGAHHTEFRLSEIEHVVIELARSSRKTQYCPDQQASTEI